MMHSTDLPLACFAAYRWRKKWRPLELVVAHCFMTTFHLTEYFLCQAYLQSYFFHARMQANLNNLLQEICQNIFTDDLPKRIPLLNSLLRLRGVGVCECTSVKLVFYCKAIRPRAIEMTGLENQQEVLFTSRTFSIYSKLLMLSND